MRAQCVVVIVLPIGPSFVSFVTDVYGTSFSISMSYPEYLRWLLMFDKDSRPYMR